MTVVAGAKPTNRFSHNEYNEYCFANFQVDFYVMSVMGVIDLIVLSFFSVKTLEIVSSYFSLQLFYLKGYLIFCYIRHFLNAFITSVLHFVSPFFPQLLLLLTTTEIWYRTIYEREDYNPSV
jgi:hypothetical protein